MRQYKGFYENKLKNYVTSNDPMYFFHDHMPTIHQHAKSMVYILNNKIKLTAPYSPKDLALSECDENGHNYEKQIMLRPTTSVTVRQPYSAALQTSFGATAFVSTSTYQENNTAVSYKLFLGAFTLVSLLAMSGMFCTKRSRKIESNSSVSNIQYPMPTIR